MATFVHNGRGPVTAPPMDPDSKDVYGAAWAEWLDGDSIAASAWIISPALVEGQKQDAVTVVHNGITYTDVNTIELSGATEGVIYRVTNRVTSGTGRIDDRTMIIECLEK